MSAPGTIEFKRVLIAHRGEIAPPMVRAFRDASAGDTGRWPTAICCTVIRTR